MPREEVEAWLQALLVTHLPRRESVGYALAHLARQTGHRDRDLSEDVRQQVHRWLRKMEDEEHFRDLLADPDPDAVHGGRDWFLGEAPPPADREGPTPARAQGTQWMMQWVRRGRMLRLITMLAGMLFAAGAVLSYVFSINQITVQLTEFLISTAGSPSSFLLLVAVGLIVVLLSFVEQLDYHGKLSSQFPVQPLRIVYAASGMHLCAAQVADDRAVMEHGLYWATLENQMEGRFLCAVLNAAVTTQLARPYMSYGKDERHVDKHVWRLPIPRFHRDDDLHRELASLAEEVERKVQELPLDAGKSFIALRRQIRRFLAADPTAQRIEELVAELLQG